MIAFWVIFWMLGLISGGVFAYFLGQLEGYVGLMAVLCVVYYATVLSPSIDRSLSMAMGY